MDEKMILLLDKTNNLFKKVNMKKLALIISFLSMFVNYSQVTQQDIGPSSYEVQLVPASPDVADLGKFGKLPVNKYNGTANVSIPIHQIEFDGLSIPIALNYNTSGVRVNQDASWVGLGWSLNEGYVVTRDVNGFDDLNSSTMDQKSNGWIYTKEYLSGPFHPDYKYEMYTTDLYSLDSLYIANFPDDTEPDVFNVSLPCGSVRFYLPKIVSTETELIANVLSDGNYKVNYDITNKTFEVIDPNGFIYDFTEKELSTGFGSWNANPTSSELDALNGIPWWSTNQTRMMIKAWKISRITSPMGKVLNFSYQDGFFMSYPSFSESFDFYTIGIGGNDLITNISSGSVNVSVSLNAFHVKYLTTISGDFGSMVFNLGTRDDLFSKDAKYRLTNWLGGGSVWNPSISPNTYNAKRLESIDLKDPNDTIVKQADFTYSYFNQNQINHTIKEKFIRLKLDDVTIQGKVYQFDYDHSDSIADKDSKSIDFWGFYNGAANSTRIPTYNRFQHVAPSSANNYTDFESYNKLIGANRKSDINYGKYGILTKVIYPTGGSSEFVYEGNSVTLKSPIYTPSEYSNGDFKYSEVKSSVDYNFRYQYLKLANDATYKFKDNSTIAPCSTALQNISTSNSTFDIEDTSFCNGQTYNISISATLNCSVGCNQGINPTGPAVWIENTQTGQVYNVFNFDNQFDINTTSVSLQQDLNLPLGNYVFKYNSWSTSTPFLVVATTSSSATVYEDSTVISPILDFYEEFEVGGARIQKIINKDTNGNLLTTKEYDYNEVIADGTISSSGKLMDDLIFASSGQGQYEYSPEVFTGNNRATLHSDNRIRYNPSASGSHVGYSTVTEYNLDSSNNTNGKITSQYTNITNDYISRNIGCTYYVLGSCGTCPMTYSCIDYTGGLDCNEIENLCSVSSFDLVYYEDVYLLNAPTISYEHLNGNISHETVFDNLDNKLSETSNNYQEYTGGFGNFIYYPIMTRISNRFFLPSPYNKILNSDLKNNKFSKKRSSTSKQFFDQDSITMTKGYYYEGSGHSRLTKTVTTNSNSEMYIAKAFYPQDVPNEPFMTSLISENRLATPIITESFANKDEDPPTPDVLLSKQTTVYSNLNNNNNLVLPYKVITQKDSISQQEQVLYEQYNDKGNLLQYIKPEGMTVSFIWGYKEQYPVAKIENATHSQVVATLTSIEQTNIKEGSYSDVTMRSTLSKIRTSLPDSQVTTYTYDPLIGVTSITDPSGYTLYYVYEDFNRLQYIKDKDGNVLKSYKYHYQGQSDSNAIVEYTITSTTNGNGAITVPSTVNEGDDVQVSITPNTGYEITSIKVNNIVQPVSTSFTIENVTNNLIVDVEFSLISNITVSYVIDGGTNGTVSVSPSVVSYGGSTTITLTPDSGYEVEYVKVGTTSYTVTNNTATITNITADIDVHVSFIALALTVSPTSLSFNFIDGNKTITVTASGAWTVSKSDSWIIVSTTTGSGNSTFTIRPLKNLGSPRFGTVTVSNGSTTKIISIEQFGDEMF